MLAQRDSRWRLHWSSAHQGEAAVTARFRLAVNLAVLAAFALGLSGWHGAASTAAAQSAPPKRSAKADAANAGEPAIAAGQQRIVVVVNDEAITARDIDQRARFTGLSSDISAQAKENFQRLANSESTQAAMRKLEQEVIGSNPGKSKEELIAIFKERQQQYGMSLQKQAVESARARLLPKLKAMAREELIDERLKLQSAKKLGIEVKDEEVKGLLKDVADRNKMTLDQFAKHLNGMGVDIATMGEKFRAGKAWREMIGRRYAAQASVSQRDVDLFLAAAAAESGVDTVELQLHRISLALAGRTDQTTWTRRYSEAEGLRRRFSGCKTMGDLARSAADSKFEDMKFVKPASIAEPMRSMLLSAKDNEALPPVTTAAGVDLYAVCARRTVGDDSKRVAAMQVLHNKELEILAQRHLRNLRQEANIDYKIDYK
jgi:peptidyl-prolyl cis-trans isomerase SurA